MFLIVKLKLLVKCLLDFRVMANEDSNKWTLMSVKFTTLTYNRFIFWSGRMDDTRMMMQTNKDNMSCSYFYFHSAMAINNDETRLYCCPTSNSYDITQFDFIENKWNMIKDLKSSKPLIYKIVKIVILKE